jgi:hypothetical protein
LLALNAAIWFNWQIDAPVTVIGRLRRRPALISQSTILSGEQTRWTSACFRWNVGISR